MIVFSFDAATVIKSSPVDGIHSEADAHLSFARSLHLVVGEIFNTGSAIEVVK